MRLLLTYLLTMKCIVVFRYTCKKLINRCVTRPILYPILQLGSGSSKKSTGSGSPNITGSVRIFATDSVPSLYICLDNSVGTLRCNWSKSCLTALRSRVGKTPVCFENPNHPDFFLSFGVILSLFFSSGF